MSTEIAHGAEMAHDPEKTLGDLRDHLARHDKPIAFLFGAGTSCAVTVPDGQNKSKPLIPAVKGLTEECKRKGSELGERYAKAWESIESHCKDVGLQPHVENVLSRLRMMLRAIGKGDKLCGLKVGEIEKLEECVRMTIAEIVTPDLTQLSSDIPHRRFARWLAKTSRRTSVEIFTVNYDVLIEYALEAERLPTFDGFVGSYQPFFHADTMRRTESAPGSNWTRLWKMHGSVTWRRVVREGRERIVRAAPSRDGEMILPSFQKYDESRQQPYAAFSDRLSRFLDQDNAMLVVVGFSFGDDHINNLIFGALENRPLTHVYALQYEELAEDHVLIKRAKQRNNLIVIGPETGVIGGRRGRWVAATSPTFVKGVFEQCAAAEQGTEDKPGVMKIGDFVCFSEFLQTMVS